VNLQNETTAMNERHRSLQIIVRLDDCWLDAGISKSVLNKSVEVSGDDDADETSLHQAGDGVVRFGGDLTALRNVVGGWLDVTFEMSVDSVRMGRGGWLVPLVGPPFCLIHPTSRIFFVNWSIPERFFVSIFFFFVGRFLRARGSPAPEDITRRAGLDCRAAVCAGSALNCVGSAT
jgi:hypothetical protein